MLSDRLISCVKLKPDFVGIAGYPIASVISGDFNNSNHIPYSSSGALVSTSASTINWDVDASNVKYIYIDNSEMPARTLTIVWHDIADNSVMNYYDLSVSANSYYLIRTNYVIMNFKVQ